MRSLRRSRDGGHCPNPPHPAILSQLGPTRFPKTGHRTRLTEADMTADDPMRPFLPLWSADGFSRKPARLG